jgi:CBS domain-containing protein
LPDDQRILEGISEKGVFAASTERDLLQKVAGQGLDFSQCMVEDFMSLAQESSKAEHPLAYALHRMIISDIRYLPIVDEDDRPEGIISLRDVIAYMNKRFSNR